MNSSRNLEIKSENRELGMWYTNDKGAVIKCKITWNCFIG